jgi:two-component system chemotaxis sensor kinase CheA
MSALSHELENLLDALRLGKASLTQSAMDLLFRGIDLYARILAVEKGVRQDPLEDIDAFLRDLGGLVDAQPEAAVDSPLAEYELEPGVLGVLTEYEEHRLRTNIEQGQKLYRLRVTFALATIDDALNHLKAAAKPHGEIITYLPTGEGADADSIELDIVLASNELLETLQQVLSDEHTRVEEIPRRARAKTSLAARSVAAPSQHAGAGPSELPPVPEGEVRESVAVKAAAPEISLKSVTQTVRVDIRRLDVLMNIVGELSIVRNAIGRLSDAMRKSPDLRQMYTELYRLHRGFERHLAELQSGILEVRMVPLGQLFDKLARVVRQISREADKEVNLVITGAETEVDKLIVEELSDPLMHMIRNAIDHAIEARIEREKVGKPAIGTIALNAFQKASHVVIEIEDDGHGIDEQKVVQAAVRKGIITEEQIGELGLSEIHNLIFVPGLTTKTDVGELSGRGVGMDVVRTNISKLGGIIDIYSEPGIGTRFTVTLPITLAIIGALIVRVAQRTFAIPLSSVQEAIWLDPQAVRQLEGRDVMTLRGQTLSLCSLRELFGFTDDAAQLMRPYVVVVGLGLRRLGIVVDRIVGQQDIVIKPLGRSLSRVRGFAGATELGDQHVALVLDAPALIDEAFRGAAESALGVAGYG